MRTWFAAAGTDRNQSWRPDLLVAVGAWGVAMCFLPLQGSGLGAAGVGAVAVLLIGCIWEPRRLGVDRAALGWRLPVVALTLLAGMALLVAGVSPRYTYLGEGARLGCMYGGVALTGVAAYILNRLPRETPRS
jgi:hypothetical protein